MFATGQTDIGRKRHQNQDAIFISMGPVGPLPNLFAVADGMGGHNAGDVASSQAVDFFARYIREGGAPLESDGFLDVLVSAASAANRHVYEQSSLDYELRGMGTTLTACTIEEGKCAIVHIGDSRAYLIKRHTITQLTADHSFVNEMVKAGQLTLSQAREHPKRNILTRVLGVDAEAQLDGYLREVEADNLILLCSDGLTTMLRDEDILRICKRSEPLEERRRLLVDEANAQGGSDNISVVLIEL